MAHAGGALAGLAHDRESFRQNLMQRFLLAIVAIVFVARVLNRLRDSVFELERFCAQLIVGKLLNRRLERIYPLDRRADAL